MRERRTLVVLGLALLYLALAATVPPETADVAWAPSYFDGDAGDAAPIPLSERLPALAGAPAARVRFRAPPHASPPLHARLPDGLPARIVVEIPPHVRSGC
jgi:hypothetical protein